MDTMTDTSQEPIEVETKVSDAGACAKKVEVTIAADKVTKEFDHVTGELASQIRLPGFRAGRVPREVVIKRHGADIFKQVTANLLQRGLQSAIVKEKMELVGEPSVDVAKYKAERGSNFVFEAEVEVKPVFEVGNYKNLDIEQEELDVLPEEFNQAVERIRGRFAEVVEADAGYALVNNDSADASVRYVVEGKEIHKSDDEKILVIDGAVLGLGVSAKADTLLGAKKGEKRTFEAALEADFAKEEFRGKTATVEVEIKAIKSRKMPELNDELAKKVGLTTADELKEKVRASLLETLSSELKSRTQYGLLDKVVEATKFDLPARLTQTMQYRTMQSSAQYLQQMGMDAKGFEAIEDQFTEDAKKKAETEMRRFFVVDAICAKESIAIGEDDIDAEIVKRARAQGMKASEMYDRMIQDGSLRELEVDLKIQRCLDYLVEQANVKVVPRKAPVAGEAAGHDHGIADVGHSHGHSHSHDGVICEGDHGGHSH